MIELVSIISKVFHQPAGVIEVIDSRHRFCVSPMKYVFLPWFVRKKIVEQVTVLLHLTVRLSAHAMFPEVNVTQELPVTFAHAQSCVS